MYPHNLRNILIVEPVQCAVQKCSLWLNIHTIFLGKTPLLNQLPVAAMSLVKWALRPEGAGNSFKSCVIAITSTNQWDSPTHKKMSVITIPFMTTVGPEVLLKPTCSQWHRATVVMYAPEIPRRTLCLELRLRYETHLIKPFNLSSPSGKAQVADAIIAAWVLSGILS